MRISNDEWKKKLTSEQYQVLREKGTEAPFSGEYDSVFDPGTYTCAGCGAELFDSETKFDAHCGWPSFYDAKPGTVELHQDDSLGMVRTEVTCANCGGHLGHVFEGEGHGTPTDQRYCINSVSLQFNKK
jgi:peptide-methionine (R)-S-oxide reductase